MKISNIHSPSFKAGLNDNIRARFAMFSAPNISYTFRQTGMDADFGYNRPVACCCAAVNDIFDNLRYKYNLPFWAKPPSIRTFNDHQLLIDGVKGSLGFCISDSSYVLIDQPVFEARSLFLNDKYNTLNLIDEAAERNYQNKWNSTNHFLHTYIHEWSHNIHNDMLYRTFGYDGTCPRARMRYNTWNGMYYDPNPAVNGVQHLSQKIFPKTYSDKERAEIKKEISQYAAGVNASNGEKVGGNPFEVVAEYMTKNIVNTLDENTLLPTRNPFADGSGNSKTVNDIIANAWKGIIT